MKYHQFIWISFLLGCFTAPIFAANFIQDIQNSEDIDLSGITFCDERLYVIADNDDTQIYQIDFIENNKPLLTLVKEITPSSPPSPPLLSFERVILWLQRITGKRFDWEAIGCPNNQLVLLSESYSALYYVDENRWQAFNVSLIREIGFLKKYGASLEGMAIDGDTLYLAAERQPRGIIKIRNNQYFFSSLKEHESENNLPLDWSDLSVFNHQLYGLYRNQNKVCMIDTTTLSSTRCISFIEQNAHPLYDTDEPYGLAEGLAVDQDYIYIVFDNNRNNRYGYNDNRSYLIKIPNTLGRPSP